MTQITDINTAGASSQIITARSQMMQVLINGTWSGATVTLEKKVGENWASVQEWTANGYDIIETVGSGQYRFNTAGGPPTLVCDVTFDGPGSGSVA